MLLNIGVQLYQPAIALFLLLFLILLIKNLAEVMGKQISISIL